MCIVYMFVNCFKIIFIYFSWFYSNIPSIIVCCLYLKPSFSISSKIRSKIMTRLASRELEQELHHIRSKSGHQGISCNTHENLKCLFWSYRCWCPFKCAYVKTKSICWTCSSIRFRDIYETYIGRKRAMHGICFVFFSSKFTHAHWRGFASHLI